MTFLGRNILVVLSLSLTIRLSLPLSPSPKYFLMTFRLEHFETAEKIYAQKYCQAFFIGVQVAIFCRKNLW